jgi:hypothetical protein
MKKIPLTQGKFALVDDEDYERLSQYKWYASKGWNTFYANRDIWNSGDKISIPMHREILNLQYHDKKFVDHINQDGLDNRKKNLRIATKATNAHNSKLQRNNTSGYRGVVWHKQINRWMARIVINGITKNCGCYKTKEEAAVAFDNAVREFRDSKASLNFPIKEDK